MPEQSRLRYSGYRPTPSREHVIRKCFNQSRFCNGCCRLPPVGTYINMALSSHNLRCLLKHFEQQVAIHFNICKLVAIFSVELCFKPPISRWSTKQPQPNPLIVMIVCDTEIWWRGEEQRWLSYSHTSSQLAKQLRTVSEIHGAVSDVSDTLQITPFELLLMNFTGSSSGGFMPRDFHHLTA